MAPAGDTYCGIYCDACSIRVHGETGRAVYAKGKSKATCGPPGSRL